MGIAFTYYSRKTIHIQSRQPLVYGFSLVELSVVLVIIGLITGVVVAAQSMIENSKGKTVLSEMNDMLQAISAFHDRYHYRPGDIPASAANRNFSAAAQPTGSGDFTHLGDSRINTLGERDVLWVQLSEAEMIKESMVRVANPASDTRILGTNRPKSNVTGGGWTWVDEYTLNPSVVTTYNSVLRFGGVAGADGGESLEKPILSIANMRYIDGKMDTDNTPVAGKITVGEAACHNANSYVTNGATLCTLNYVESITQ